MIITNVVFTKTGEDSHNHELGTITVTFSNQQWRPFENIERGHFDTWAESGFKPSQVPYVMQHAFRMYWDQFQREENEKLFDDLESEASGDEPAEDETDDSIWLENVKTWYDPLTGETAAGDPPDDKPSGTVLENLGVDSKGRIWLEHVGMWWDPNGLVDDEEG